MNIKRLNRLVSDSGKSKVQLAKACGITRVTLDNALQGGDIRVSILEALASALNVEVGYFFGNEPTQNATATNHSVAANGDVNIRTTDSAHLEERIKLLEQLVADKERTIMILMGKSDEGRK